MKKFEKNYIGKGTKVKDLEIVTASICMDDAEEHIFEYEGKRYLKFEVAQLREADKWNKTHTVYVNNLVDVTDEGEMTTLPEEKPRKNTRKKATANK